VVSTTPRPFTRGKDPVPVAQEAGRAPGRRDGHEKPHPTGIRSPDRLARSKSLYRLSYTGRPLLTCNGVISGRKLAQAKILHLHLMGRFRMNGIIPLFPLYVFGARRLKNKAIFVFACRRTFMQTRAFRKSVLFPCARLIVFALGLTTHPTEPIFHLILHTRRRK
jgi:hypothetical protein